jgi:hypothetical protein
VTDFSSVNLRILSPDGKTVLAELQTLDRVNQATARRIGDTQSAAVAQVGRQAATSARQIAGNVAQIAAAGEATASSMRGIISQGANIAFMFGTGGAIAGAIGVTGLAIVSLFTRAQKEIEATARKAAEELRTLAQSSNIGGIGGKFGVATTLFSGDRFAVRAEDESDRAFQARLKGIQGIRAEIARQQAIVDANLGGGGTAQAKRQTALNHIHEWQRELDKMVPRYERLIGLMRELEDAESHAAAQVTANVKQEATSGGPLDRLLGRNGIPDVKALGFNPSAINPVELGDQMLETIRQGLRNVPSIDAGELTPELEEIIRIDSLAASLGTSFGLALVGGLTDGITSALSGGGLGGAFQAMTGAVLVGIGNMAIQIGMQSAAVLTLMEKIKLAIATFMPGAGLVAAIGMIGLGAGLVALGGSMGGGRGGRGSGGTSYGSQSGGRPTTYIGTVYPTGTTTDMSAIKPTPPITVNANLIGTRDPSLQRELLTMIKFARQRGEV